MNRAACGTLRALCLAMAGFFSIALAEGPFWVILEAGKGDGTQEMLKVVQEKKEAGGKGKVLLQEADGRTQEVEEGRILSRIPVFPEGGNKIEREQGIRAINLLLEAKNKAPALEKPLQEEVERWKGLIDKIPNAEDPEALAKVEEIFARAVAQAMPQPHDPMVIYTAEQLEVQIQALEKLKKEFPARIGEIQQLMDPWEIEARSLQEGKRKFEGRWLSAEEWDQERGARERVAKEAFLKTIHPPDVSPALIGQGAVLAALVAGAAGLFFGISFLFHGLLEMMRRRSWWKGMAWVTGGLLVVGVMARGAGLIFSMPEPWDARSNGDAKVIEERLWSGTGQKKPFPREIRVSDADLNSWWGQRLHPGPLSVLEILVVRLETWKVQFLDGGMRRERTGKLLGQPLVLRHEMTLRRSEEGEEIYRMEGSLGRMPLPPAVVLRFWEKWTEDVAKLAEFFSAPSGIRLERLEKGGAVFSVPPKKGEGG